jgi:hypothetical protein
LAGIVAHVQAQAADKVNELGDWKVLSHIAFAVLHSTMPKAHWAVAAISVPLPTFVISE